MKKITAKEYWAATQNHQFSEEELDYFAELEADHELEEAAAFVREYGEFIEDSHSRRCFFEGYFKFDSWLLFDEALAIYYCVDPRFIDPVARVYSLGYYELRAHVDAAVGVTLKVLNPNAPKDEWRVTPRGFVHWLISKGLEVPPELMQLFGGRPAKPKNSNHPNAERHAQRREQVLAAALAVMASVPGKCKKNGKFSPTAIATQIDLFSKYVYGEYEESPLSERRTKEIISEAINLIPES